MTAIDNAEQYQIDLDWVVSSAVRRSMLRWDSPYLYWLEQRPHEQGKSRICRWSEANGVEDFSPKAYNVRSRVHEYGGGEFDVKAGQLICVSDPDQQLNIYYPDPQVWQSLAVNATKENRYADFSWHPNLSQFAAVNELHISDKVHNALHIMALDGSIQIVSKTADFYASPRFDSTGQKLVWVEWDNPNMPWDNTRLMMAFRNKDGEYTEIHRLNLGTDESVQQPSFSPENELYAISDRSGYWNLYRVHTSQWTCVFETPLECAMAPWSLGQRSYVINEHQIVISALQNGQQKLLLLDRKQNNVLSASAPYTSASLAMTDSDELARLASNADQAERLELLKLSTGDVTEIKANNKSALQSKNNPKRKDTFIIPQLLMSSTGVPFWFYPLQPTNGKLAPTILFCHSGPTGIASGTFNPLYQYWIANGFQIADVNYRGSEGFGRQWRQSLQGNWGVFDVADSHSVVDYLVEEHLASPESLFLRGNSAGGYTALHLLAQTNLFCAAALRYPVIDLNRLIEVSHKFEAHYLLALVGAKTEACNELDRLSPLSQIQSICTPLLIHHGELDPVVPLKQSFEFVQRLQSLGKTAELHAFSDEGHGFKAASTLKLALRHELEVFQSCL